MGILGCNSFEDVTTTAALVARFSSSSGTPTSATTGARTGSRSMGLVSGASVTQNVSPSGTSFTIGVAIYLPALPLSSTTILTLTPNTGSTFQISVNATGQIVIGGLVSATTATVVVAGTLIYLQLRVTLNGASSSYAGVFGSLPVSGTFTASSTSIVSFTLAASTQTYYDDLVFGDGTALLGQPKVECLRPTGAGANTGLSLSGAATDWQAVAEATPDDDTSFVFSTTAGAKDTYQTGNLAAVAGAVTAVQVNLRARKDDALTRQVCPEFHISGTDYDGGTKTLTTGYLDYTDVSEVSPATGVAWTIAEINAAEVGIKVIA